MRILISGSSGLVGSALLQRLPREGHTLGRLVRSNGKVSDHVRADPVEHAEIEDVSWSTSTGNLGPNADGADAVIHLAGVSIANGRWNPARKTMLRDSRVAGTRHLIDGLKRLSQPPKIFIAASAIGFYGDRGDEELTEASPPGIDFLAQLCIDWEKESARAAEFGARVVQLRFGVILARDGGALPKMVTPFRLGAGGPLGTGRQWMSWIALEDVVGIVLFALSKPQISQAFNVVAPHPVRNSDFAKSLGRVLHRPAVLPTPSFVLRLALGEMADSLLLSSQRVLPQRLQEIGYQFVRTELGDALRSVLGRAQ